MGKTKAFNRVLANILLLCLLLGTFVPGIVNADVVSDSESSYTVKNSDGEVVLEIIMKKGVITIEAYSHKASTDIRWNTIGLTITRDKIQSKTTAKGYSGPGPVSDAYGSGKAYLWFKDAGDKEDVDISNDIVMTTFTFDADYVNEKFKGELDDITKDTTIYLHGIFQTFNNDTGVIRKNNIKNWEDIMNEEWWGSDTLSDFIKYFNMPIEFQPGETCPTTLYYKSVGGVTLKDKKELGSVKPYEAMSWSNEPTVLQKKDKDSVLRTYDLVSYYTTKKNDSSQKKIEEYSINGYLKGGYDLDWIRTNSIDVEPGGMNVYLIYEIRPLNKPGKPTPAPIPVPSKPPKPTVTPKPFPTPIPVPKADSATDSMTEIDATGSIRADNRGNEKFTVTAGVPTTESLYTEVKSTKWLMGYDLEKKVGTETYAVRATKNYELSWTVQKLTVITGSDGKAMSKMVSETKTETVPVTQTVSIQRAYGYWQINNFDLYQINNAKIDNYALPGGSTTMTPNYAAGYNPPSASTSHSSSKSSHIIIPSQITGGVQLASESISGGTSRPSIPSADFTAEADSIIPELTVKNDSIIINGTTVMSDAPTKREGPDIKKSFLSGLKAEGKEKCNENILYKPDQVIQDIKKNGTYNSSGVITYSRINSINSKFNPNIYADIKNLSNVVIHTPVLCDPIVKADNDKYVQLINPNNATQLVLDPDQTLNDFTVHISNTGHHSHKAGYYTRDFSHNLRGPENVSYIASENGKLLNEVKFPFDVYMKEADKETFIKKNTWIVIDRSTVTFYLPMWVVEGVHTVDCRTIAVNADMSRLEQISEQYVNSELFNYVATNTFKVEVSGRMYGLSIYDISDYPLWQEAFRVKDSLDLKINDPVKYPDGTNKLTYSRNYSYNYTTGTKDQYGKDTGRNVKYTFPLVNGNHPFFQNIGVLKTGYIVRFTLDTIGCMYSEGNYVKIKPSFYYVDKDGKNRTAVDLYYEENINGKNQKLVKMGNSLDQINMKTMEVGSPYTGIPKDEIKDTISIINKKYTTFITRIEGIFTFKDIRIPTAFRTFINRDYTNKIAISDQYSKITAAGTTKNDIMKQMQSWYGCYYLPGILHAAPLGFDVYGYAKKYGVRYTEDFWKKNGYIIVNFDIVTIDSSGAERLSYINSSNYLFKGNNSMWVMEGAPVSKTDNKGITFNFKAGDFIIYNTDKSVHDDYSIGGIY